MTQEPHSPRVSRRTVLKGTALAGISAFIAACTGAKATPAPATQAPSLAPGETPAPTPSPTPAVATGPLMFANWPAYIDLAGAAGDAGEYSPGSSPTLEEFKTKYSVDVDYQEKISDNNTFVQTITPALVAGLPTGWDLIVITDWMAAKVVTNGWAEKIDQDKRAQLHREPPRRAQEPGMGPGQRLPLPVAVRDDRRGLQLEDAQGEQRRRADQDR